MVYTGDLKSPAERIEGSSPSSRTKCVHRIAWLLFLVANQKTRVRISLPAPVICNGEMCYSVQTMFLLPWLKLQLGIAHQPPLQITGSKVFMDAHMPVTHKEGDRYPLDPPSFRLCSLMVKKRAYTSPKHRPDKPECAGSSPARGTTLQDQHEHTSRFIDNDIFPCRFYRTSKKVVDWQ